VQEHFEDTKEVIRSRKLKKDRQYNDQNLEDTKVVLVIRSRKSKYRQYNGQKKEDKRTNNDLQNITQKTKDQVTLTH